MSRNNRPNSRRGAKKTEKPLSQPPVPPPTPPALAPDVRSDDRTLGSWLSSHGVIGLIFAIGVAMTGAIDYWIGVLLIVGGTGWAALDFWWKFRSERRKATAGVAAIIAICGLFLWQTYVSAPLEVTIVVPSEPLKAGQSLLGLEWKPNSFLVIVGVTNPTDVEYDNIDARFLAGGGQEFSLKFPNGDPNLQAVVFAEGRVEGGLNNCIIGSDVILMPGSQFTEGQLTITIREPNAGQIRSNVARTRCDRISPHSTVQIVIALDHLIRPDWIVADIQYTAASRHRSSYPIKCVVVGKCRALDKVAREFVGSMR